MKKYYTRAEVAKRWKCHRTTVEYRLREGDMKEVKLPSGKHGILIDDIILVETLKPVNPRKYVSRPRKNRPKPAVAKLVEVKVTLWSKIKKYIHDRIIK